MATSDIRWSILVPGIICLLLGSIWALQGLGIIGGSFMSRQLLWTGIGAIVFIIGLLLAYRGSPLTRSKRSAGATSSRNA